MAFQLGKSAARTMTAVSTVYVSFGNGTDNFEFFVLLAQRAASITIKIFQPSEPRMIAIVVGNTRRTRVCHIKRSMSQEMEAKIRPLRGWRLYSWPVPETKRLNTAASVALFRGDAGLGAACAVVAKEDSGIGENSDTSKLQNSRFLVQKDSFAPTLDGAAFQPKPGEAIGLVPREFSHLALIACLWEFRRRTGPQASVVQWCQIRSRKEAKLS